MKKDKRKRRGKRCRLEKRFAAKKLAHCRPRGDSLLVSDGGSDFFGFVKRCLVYLWVRYLVRNQYVFAKGHWALFFFQKARESCLLVSSLCYFFAFADLQ